MSDSDSDEMGIGIMDVKVALEDVYKGCLVDIPSTMAGSFHAELTFHEYEIRVILAGKRRGNAERGINFRFMQRVKGPGRKPIKVVINEVRTTDPRELLKAIRHSKEYLLGIVHCINHALKRKPVPQVHDIEDLLLGGD